MLTVESNATKLVITIVDLTDTERDAVLFLVRGVGTMDERVEEEQAAPAPKRPRSRPRKQAQAVEPPEQFTPYVMDEEEGMRPEPEPFDAPAPKPEPRVAHTRRPVGSPEPIPAPRRPRGRPRKVVA
jgi:hypothetical protein